MAIEDVLLIGGAAGVGKTSVGWEVSTRLATRRVAHWHVDGDALDAVWPRPDDDPDGQRLTRRSLAALAEVFAAEGYRRCLYVQTAAPLDIDLLGRALGEEVELRGVLLTATAATRARRLAGREIGSGLDRHLASSRRMAERLEAESPAWVRRIATDDRPVTEIADEVIKTSGWA